MAAVDLHWLPLGAGVHFVRLNGRVYEALAAPMQRRPAYDLGVVASGAVGSRWTDTAP